jgi:hypothetical protein
MKTCTRCGIEKPIEEFYKSKNYKDGYSYECKSCNSERSKKWYLENLEKVREAGCKYRLENPERKKDTNKKWYLKNIDKIKAVHKKWYLKNTEKTIASSKKWRLENHERALFSKIKTNLKKQIGETPPPELVEVKLLINKTKRLCKTLKN